MLEAYRSTTIGERSAWAGATAHDVHVAVAKPFRRRGFGLGHVTGHSIGMTMIEFPKIGEGVDVELQQDMVISMHPHVLSPDQDLSLHAGHVARDRRRRGAAGRATPQGLRRSERR